MRAADARSRELHAVGPEAAVAEAARRQRPITCKTRAALSLTHGATQRCEPYE